MNLQGCYKLFASQCICTMNQSRKIQLNINSLWLIFFLKASDIDCTWESNKAQVIENVTIWTSLDLSQKNFQNKFLTLGLLDYDKNVGLGFFTHGFTIWRYFGCHSTNPVLVHMYLFRFWFIEIFVLVLKSNLDVVIEKCFIAQSTQLSK